MEAQTTSHAGPGNPELDAGWALLPPEAPLQMPEQTLREGKLKVPRHRTSPRMIKLRRLYLFGGTAAMTAVATRMMWRVLSTNGISVLEACLLVLFVGLFAWIALSFASAVAGFLTAVFDRGYRLGIDPDKPLPIVHSRTALLMPTYNEDPRRLLAGLRAIYESVAATGQLERFDFFVLSDTRREDIARAEERVFNELRELVPDGKVRLFYRRRSDNGARKAGNIADWVRRFGGAYPQMLILDADSLMTGDSIVRLVAGMEHNADVGLIQTLPSVIGGRTLFSRLQPFGGHVLSHDFVEAALMRRGGWAAHMVPYLGGSYEEGPPTLTDMLVRDRRWCQGNLQHGKVVGSRGLHWISRVHMLIGIGHYFTAPMWGMLMLIGIAIPLFQEGIDFNALLHLSPSVYWRAQDEEQVVRLFGATMAVLLLPKVLGYLAMLLDPVDRRGCGGAFRAFVSMLVETVLAALMAPVVMYVQSRGVAEVLSGRDSGWDAQQRDDGGISWMALIRGYGGLGVFGAFMGVLAWAVSPSLAVWMAPVVIGMVLAIPVVALTSSRGPGGFLHRWGLLDIPEENTPPPVLVRAAELRREAAEQPPLY